MTGLHSNKTLKLVFHFCSLSQAATEAGSAQGLLDSQRARVEELRSQVQGRALETMNERAKRLDALRQVRGG